MFRSFYYSEARVFLGSMPLLVVQKTCASNLARSCGDIGGDAVGGLCCTTFTVYEVILAWSFTIVARATSLVDRAGDKGDSCGAVGDIILVKQN